MLIDYVIVNFKQLLFIIMYRNNFLLIFFFFLTFLLPSCMIIEPYNVKYYLNLNKEKQKEFKIEPLDFNNQFNNEILSINSENFISVIEKDTSEYKLIVFFTFWCPSSQEYLPTFIQQTKNLKIRIFYISPDDWVYKPQYIAYKTNLKINGNIYLLDVYHYGEKRNPHYRMSKFISEICNDCKEIKGFPSFMMFNKNNEIIFKNVGEISNDTISKMIKKKPITKAHSACRKMLQI